ncbi:zinc finger domain-containing protein [Nocardiopsis metallicus]|uniref:DNA-binding phage zinc finger domain-containing protein n=1 Tax=Nocardiopsis metallicus TaxID=179819 RepID=A0A840WG96_9ACTN|nr:hypothetical protein [Nocardiopsis metallicus]
MTEPIEVSCECGATKGEACRTFSFGSYHRSRVQKSANWERSLEATRKKRTASLNKGRKVQIVEPLGDSSLVESFTLTVRCPARQCKAAPGNPCTGRVEWHAQRSKRGAELKARYDNQNEG